MEEIHFQPYTDCLAEILALSQQFMREQKVDHVISPSRMYVIFNFVGCYFLEAINFMDVSCI